MSVATMTRGEIIKAIQEGDDNRPFSAMMLGGELEGLLIGWMANANHDAYDVYIFHERFTETALVEWQAYHLNNAPYKYWLGRVHPNKFQGAYAVSYRQPLTDEQRRALRIRFTEHNENYDGFIP